VDGGPRWHCQEVKWAGLGRLTELNRGGGRDSFTEATWVDWAGISGLRGGWNALGGLDWVGRTRIDWVVLWQGGKEEDWAWLGVLSQAGLE
jgi:hypothetical protein